MLLTVPFDRAVHVRLFDALGALIPASASLVGQRELLRRHDSKFCLPIDRVAELLRAIAPSYRVVLAGGSPLAAYDTLYYDTPELTYYHDHRRGRRRRTKIRVRHYLDRELTYFEIKAKATRAATDKVRLLRTFGDEALGAAEDELVRNLCPAALGRLAPVLWTRFHRVTLVARGAAERATLDLGLRVDGLDGRSVRLDRVAILEVKQARFDRSTPIMRALRRHRARAGALSKYCVGVVSLGLSARTGSFRARLRAMEAA